MTTTSTDLARPGPGDDDEGAGRSDDSGSGSGPGSDPGSGPDSGADSGAGADPEAAAARAPWTTFGRWLTVIAVGGLAVRVVYLLGWKNTGVAWSDAFYYHEGANLLADGRGYVHPFQWIYHGFDLPGADHPPGYLTLLSGFSVLGFRSFLAHQLFSCLVGTIGVVAMGWTGRRIAGERVGLLTALIVALSPNVWFHDALVMSESLVVATTAFVLWAAYRWWDRPTLAAAIVFGLAVGVAALVRSEALLLGPFVGVPLVWWRRRQLGWAWSAAGRHLALAGGLAALVVAPWIVHNVMRFEHPVTLSAQFDHTLVSANCDEVYYGDNTGYWSRSCVEAVEGLTDPRDDASEEGLVYRRLARDYVGNHSGRAALVAGARVGRTFGLYQPGNQLDLDLLSDGKEKGLGEAGLLSWYVVAVAGGFGLLGLRRAGRPIFPIVAVVAATTVTVVVTYGATRFRFPAELALCIPAAVTLDAALGAFGTGRARRRRRPDTPAESVAGGPGGLGSAAAPPPVVLTTTGAPPPPDDDALTSGDGAPPPPDDDALASGDGESDLGDLAPGSATSPGGDLAAGGSSLDVARVAGRAGASITFAGLDGLRAVAALGVLVCHVALASGQITRSGGEYLARADVGVALFFMLSGFLLYRPFVGSRLDGKPRPATDRYLRHRFLRIFPAYWLALTVLTTVLDVRQRADIRTPWDFAMYYGLLQSYSRSTAVGGLQQAWTLTNELAFYLLLPLWAFGAAWLFRRLRGRSGLVAEGVVLALCAAGSLAFRTWVESVGGSSLEGHSFFEEFVVDPRLHWIVGNFHMFVPGMALALAFEWSRRREQPLGVLELVRKHPLVCWGVAAVAFWAVSTQLGLQPLGSDNAGDALAKELLYAAVGLFMLAPVALAGETLPRSLRWLGTWPMVQLGVLSYGIYLWHEGVTDIYRDMRDIQAPDGTYLLSGWFPAMLAFSVVGSVVLAALSYRLVERPALLLKDRDRKLFANWRPVRLPWDAAVAR